MTLFAVAAFTTITGLCFTYIAVGLVRNNERKRGEEECDERLLSQRRALLRRLR